MMSTTLCVTCYAGREGVGNPAHILRRALESHINYVWAYSNLGAALMLKGLEAVVRRIFERKLKQSARFRPGAGQYRGSSRQAPVIYGAIEMAP